MARCRAFGGDYSCDETLPFDEPAWIDECSDYTVDFEETIVEGECPQSYTVVRTWIATDECGNSSEPYTVEYNVFDNEPPVVDSMDDISVECEDELPEIGDWLAVDNCDPNPTVTTTWDFIDEWDCDNYVAEVTCIATDACGNSSSTSFFVTVSDETDPVLVDVASGLSPRL